jgi:hypothetical protein
VTANLEALDEEVPERKEVYIRSVNAMIVKVTFKPTRGMAKESTLVDSGVSENFLDQRTWQKLGIRSINLGKLI